MRVTQRKNNGSRKATSGLVALGSAAVLAVYTAGYLRTRSAADRFALEAAERRPAAPHVSSAEATVAPPAKPVVTPEHVGPAPRPAATAASHPVQPVARTVPAPIAIPDPAPTPVASDLQNGQSPDASVVPAAAVPEMASALAPPPPAPQPVAPTDQYKDGTYYGWGTSRHGDIQAAVVIEGGRIASATIARCLTRYSCSVIAALPPQVAARQSPDVDFVSGATQSTNAFYYAVVEALSKAR